jgi:hypothetical protein
MWIRDLAFYTSLLICMIGFHVYDVVWGNEPWKLHVGQIAVILVLYVAALAELWGRTRRLHRTSRRGKLK